MKSRGLVKPRLHVWCCMVWCSVYEGMHITENAGSSLHNYPATVCGLLAAGRCPGPSLVITAGAVIITTLIMMSTTVMVCMQTLKL